MNTLGRVCVVLVICIGLPLLAMPKVRQKVEDFLYGKLDHVIPPLPAGPATSPPAISPGGAEPIGPPPVVGRAEQASFEAPLSAPPLSPQPARPFPDLSPARPPDLAPVPAERTEPAVVPAVGQPFVINEATMNQVRNIRRQLEDMGAEYILLESTDGGRSFRFHCQMAIDAERKQLQQFETTTSNPLHAAEAVLQQVKLWRQPPASK